MVCEVLDYIFCIRIEESADVTDFRALLYTCKNIEPVIRRLCRSRIPDNAINFSDSDVTEDIKLAIFWSVLHQAPSSAIFAGSFALWLFQLSEDRRNWMPHHIDVLLEYEADRTIKVIDVTTNSEKDLQIPIFCVLIFNFVKKVRKLFGYGITSWHENDPSIENIMAVTEHYLHEDKTKLRGALPMLNLLDLLSIEDRDYYRYDMRLPRTFPISKISFMMKKGSAQGDVHALRCLVNIYDIDICRIGFVLQKQHRKFFLDFQAEDEIKNIKQK